MTGDLPNGTLRVSCRLCRQTFTRRLRDRGFDWHNCSVLGGIVRHAVTGGEEQGPVLVADSLFDLALGLARIPAEPEGETK